MQPDAPVVIVGAGPVGVRAAAGKRIVDQVCSACHANNCQP
jgi:cytochrome c5